MKQCSKCEEIKDLKFFSKHKGKKDGLRSHCKECDKLSFIKQSKDPEFKIKRRDFMRNRRKNPEFKVREKVYNRSTNFKRNFGITIEQYDEMFLTQNGNCLICGENQSKFKRRLAVDHCHETKKIRGLLCDYCNPGLGYFKDSEDILNKAILYLKRFKK